MFTSLFQALFLSTSLAYGMEMNRICLEAQRLRPQHLGSLLGPLSHDDQRLDGSG